MRISVTIQIRLQKRFDPIVVNKVEARKGQSFRQTTGLAETFQLKVRGQLVMRLVGKETTKKRKIERKKTRQAPWIQSISKIVFEFLWTFYDFTSLFFKAFPGRSRRVLMCVTN